MASWIDTLKAERKRIDRAIRKEKRRMPKRNKPEWLRLADAERTRNQFPWMMELRIRRETRKKGKRNDPQEV